MFFFLVKEDPSFEEDFFAPSDSASSEEPDSINNEIRDLIADRVRESEVNLYTISDILTWYVTHKCHKKYFCPDVDV